MSLAHMASIDLVGFDADDTLWHNEILYTRSQSRFAELLSGYGLDGRAAEELYATEMQNLRHYGYGIKSFALSMIETAIRLTDGRIQAREIQALLDIIRDMLAAPVELLDQAADVVARLARSHTLMLVTKGDLFDQERKIAQSGLSPFFAHVEIVSEKTEDTYRSLLSKHGVEPPRFLMVGNSLRSDIMPVVALGGHAVHIPYHITWEHEAVDSTEDRGMEYVELEHIGLLPAFVDRLCEGV
jgi:putative hydrolase of the HAD superfamily